MSQAGEESSGVQGKWPDRCSPEGRVRLTFGQWGAVIGAGHEWSSHGGVRYRGDNESAYPRKKGSSYSTVADPLLREARIPDFYVKYGFFLSIDNLFF